MKTKVKISVTTLLISIFCFQTVQAQETNYRMEAMFMYHFTKYIYWPENKKSGDFVIGVFGNSEIVKELETTVANKKARGQQIIIKKLNAPGESTQCHIIFVAASHNKEMHKIQNLIQGKPILLISEKAGLPKKDSEINFVVDDDKLRFEINKSNIESKTLKISGDLLKIGIIV